ncbi:hypothetical protein J132_06857, partial [Termitomyces sp. J132]
SVKHVIFSNYRLVEGFVIHRNTVEGPILYFSDLASWSWLCSVTLFFLQVLLGDAIVLYRCYLVWSSIWVIVVPGLLWITTLVTSIIMVNLYSRSGSDPQLLFSPSSNRLVGASLSCTLVGNAISTGLLAYRLWIAEVRASKYRVGQDGHMIFVARIVINSGAIYLVSQVLFLGLYFARSNAFFIVEDLVSATSLTFH